MVITQARLKKSFCGGRSREHCADSEQCIEKGECVVCAGCSISVVFQQFLNSAGEDRLLRESVLYVSISPTEVL
jgi:hypothetical protein